MVEIWVLVATPFYGGNATEYMITYRFSELTDAMIPGGFTADSFIPGSGGQFAFRAAPLVVNGENGGNPYLLIVNESVKKIYRLK